MSRGEEGTPTPIEDIALDPSGGGSTSGAIAGGAGTAKGRGGVRARGRWERILRRFLRNRLGMVGAFGLLLLYASAISAPWISPYGYSEIDLSLANPVPSLAHPMGAYFIGQDELTRVLYGGRLSLGLALAVTVLAGTVGAVVGLVSGYLGGVVDAVLAGLTDYALSLPLIPLVLVLGFLFGFSPTVFTLALALLLWPRMARLVRAEVLSVRGREYVEASRAVGVSGARIISRHLLPNVAGIASVEATSILATAILTESALSFVASYACDVNINCYLDPSIKAGVQSWGLMLGRSISTMDQQWWLAVFPGLMIVLTVIFVSFLGDGLRDALNPRAGE